MRTFESDYTTGAHPKILEKLIETNLEEISGYGEDKFTQSATEKIRAACGCPDAQVKFITGGTQTNQLVIDSILKPFEGVVAATTGHVSCHEAGAIEYTGHKVLTIPSHFGKIDAKELDDYIEDFYNDGSHEHMVYPGMVYISYPTEYGTIYTKDELESISEVCRKRKLPLFLDGARLGYGLGSSESDITIKDIAYYTDVFYIGGTKCGALCGEAVVFTKGNIPQHFTNLQKKHGALLAKGRLNAIQFDVLFTDNLYFEITKNAVDLAMFMKEKLAGKGLKFFIDSPTNQQFVVVENKFMEELKKKVGFGFWEKFDDSHTVIRFATTWSTTKEMVQELIDLF